MIDTHEQYDIQGMESVKIIKRKILK